MTDPIPLGDRTTGSIWFDGHFLPWQNSHTHVLTHSLHYASSWFEGIRILNGEAFRLPMHMRRLAESADTLRGRFILFQPRGGEPGQTEIIKVTGNYTAAFNSLANAASTDQFKKIKQTATELLTGTRYVSEEAAYKKAIVENNIDLLVDATQQVVSKSNITTGYIRPMIYWGPESVDFSRSTNKIHAVIAAWHLPYFYTEIAEEQGVRLVILPSLRKAPPECSPFWTKSGGNYLINSILKDIAINAAYNDALMLDWRGLVTEATGANAFFVGRDDKLYTPTPDCFFNGFTRQTIIKLAVELNIECVEKAIDWDEVKTMKEGFLTGTAAGIVPIQVIDHASSDVTPQDSDITASRIVDSCNLSVGPITRSLRTAYRHFINASPHNF